MISRYPLSKRLCDMILAIGGLIFLSLLIALVALLVRIKLGRPILFRQPRPGRGGKLFTLLKFRTMLDAVDANGKPLPDEHRLTKFGSFLRKTSLDELPELWNVVRGEMSIVGPRPLLAQYLERYTPEQMRRHEMPPGITGYAQVNGRNSIDWDTKFDLDLWYIDHWSLALDLQIMIKTFLVVARRSGIEGEGSVTMTEFMGSTQAGKQS